MEKIYARNFRLLIFSALCLLYGLTLKAQVYTVSGIAYLDYNDNTIFDDKDLAHPALTVTIYSDANANGSIDVGDPQIGSAISAPDGTYTITIDHDGGIPFDDYLLVIDASDVEVGSKMDTLLLPAADAAGINVSYLGKPVICYSVADVGEQLMYMNRISGVNTSSGGTLGVGVTEVETIAFAPGGDVLWAIDKQRLGTIDLGTGEFNPKPQNIGQLSGALGDKTVGDADGMTFDPFTGILYGVGRDAGDQDYLFQIDTASGLAIPDAFGPGIDYVLITGVGLNPDIDDIAINPADGKLYGVNNDPTIGATIDEYLVEISKKTGEANIIATLNYTGPLSGENISDIEGFTFTNFGLLVATTGSIAAYDLRNSMFEVNLKTGGMTPIGAFDNGEDFEGCDCLIGAINQVSGTVYSDDNTNGENNGESDLGEGIKIKVYIDSDGDGMIGPDDILVDSVLTDANGMYTWTTATNVDLILEIDQTTLPDGYMSTDDAIENIELSCCFGAVEEQNRDFGAFTQVFPVELVAFEAKYQDQKAFLNWTTVSEVNSHYFGVERSRDGRVFEALGKVDARGNSSSSVNYDYTDEAVNVLGTNKLYYRLQQVDLDGSWTYSPIVELDIPSSDLGLNIYPNPVSNILTIQNSQPSGHDIELLLVDVRGKQIRSEFLAPLQKLDWEMSKLPHGIYYLRAKQGEVLSYQKIVVE